MHPLEARLSNSSPSRLNVFATCCITQLEGAQRCVIAFRLRYRCCRKRASASEFAVLVPEASLFSCLKGTTRRLFGADFQPMSQPAWASQLWNETETGVYKTSILAGACGLDVVKRNFQRQLRPERTPTGKDVRDRQDSCRSTFQSNLNISSPEIDFTMVTTGCWNCLQQHLQVFIFSF